MGSSGSGSEPFSSVKGFGVPSSSLDTTHGSIPEDPSLKMLQLCLEEARIGFFFSFRSWRIVLHGGSLRIVIIMFSLGKKICESVVGLLR